ncbi:unnamed protein product [Trifolium pratense]|uniref:Uncharacterized protein n=1 Tax=Trifolium pratense TaxID=57577 RepID=A0ACB0KA16_TRIPR|nr:unnamed protein product [Trifolium pratense]
MDFLGDTNVASATDVVVFVPDIIETNLKLHVSIITRLLDTFFFIKSMLQGFVLVLYGSLATFPFTPSMRMEEVRRHGKPCSSLVSRQFFHVQLIFDNDSHDRIVRCIRLLYNTGDEIRKMWLESCRQSFVKMHADKQHFETEEIKTKAQILPFQEKKGYEPT